MEENEYDHAPREAGMCSENGHMLCLGAGEMVPGACFHSFRFAWEESRQTGVGSWILFCIRYGILYI